MIAVKAKTATYAIVNQNAVGRAMEIAKGMVTGSAPNVNKLREISEEELDECEFDRPMLPAIQPTLLSSISPPHVSI